MRWWRKTSRSRTTVPALSSGLRREARFSDGTPLTSADVAFSFELLKTKGKPFFRSAYGRVARFETPDPHRVEIALKDASDRELLLLIALMPIFAKHATDPASFDGPSLTPPIGSGPYVLAEVKPGESLTLRRDPTFWGKDLPLLAGLYNLDEIRTDFFRDTNTMFEAFKAGLIDLRFETDPGRWTTGYDFPALREGRVVAETLPNGNPKGMNAFAFNTRRPLLADVRVREALSLMFDFDWVNRNLYSGVYRRTTSFFEGSDLASTGIPASSTERALLAPFAGTVREDILAGTGGRAERTARAGIASRPAARWRCSPRPAGGSSMAICAGIGRRGVCAGNSRRVARTGAAGPEFRPRAEPARHRGAHPPRG